MGPIQPAQGRLKSQVVRVGNSRGPHEETHSAGQKEQPQRAIRTRWSCNSTKSYPDHERRHGRAPYPDVMIGQPGRIKA
jgi:hypothetical protein